MTEQPCRSCQAPDAETISLFQDETSNKVPICSRCLRSASRLKADAHDPSGRLNLMGQANELGWAVWRSEHVLYLIPPVVPFKGLELNDPLQVAPALSP